MENKDIITLCAGDMALGDKYGLERLGLCVGQSRAEGSGIGVNVRAKRASFRVICASSEEKWGKSGHKPAGNLQKCAGFERKFQEMACFWACFYCPLAQINRCGRLRIWILETKNPSKNLVVFKFGTNVFFTGAKLWS
jgi:hypothetical protein